MSANNWNATVLIVDDNEASRLLVSRYLDRSGFDGEVVHAETTAEAVTSLKARAIDVVVTDHFFKGNNIPVSVSPTPFRSST